MNIQQVFAVLVLMALVGCKQTPKETKLEVEKAKPEMATPMVAYPEDLVKIFKAHGGLKSWKAKKTLVYEMPADKADEVRETHTIDLYSRRDRVDMGDVSMGFDGKRVWLLDEKSTYKGDPIFYHNLMFYFYAMPFVLADDGINYGQTEALEFEGRTYPGIQIGYGDGVGTSPKDEYFIHYDPETHQMAWLGYTVTYRSGEKSDNVKWIRYNDWMTVDGLILPKSITWHEYEGRKIKAARGTASFENVSLGATAKPASFYGKPDNAKIVAKE